MASEFRQRRRLGCRGHETVAVLLTCAESQFWNERTHTQLGTAEIKMMMLSHSLLLLPALRTPFVLDTPFRRADEVYMAMEPLRRIASFEELEAVEPMSEPDGVQLLMITREGCKYSARMEKVLAERCAHPLLAGLLWEIGAADDETAESLGAKRTPLVVAFQDGRRSFDFVAQTPSALLYGLQDLEGLLSAYEEGSGF